MCDFFSCVSDGKGKIYYADWKLRQKCLSGEIDLEPDSHTSIAHYFGFIGSKEDKLNKYEYNPLTKVFKRDQINTTDDSDIVYKKLRKMWQPKNAKKIIPQLKIQPIIHPFKDIPMVKKPTKKDLDNLKQWASVRDSVRVSVRTSVGASVRASVGASVGASVRDSVGDSVGASVRDSVWDSVRDSVRDSVWVSVWTSVRDSVGAYIGSFFIFDEWKYVDHKKGIYPFQSAVDLWMRGIVPSYDGKIWRLHSGPKAEIIWEGNL